jgi:hypothetical protein
MVPAADHAASQLQKKPPRSWSGKSDLEGDPALFNALY